MIETVTKFQYKSDMIWLNLPGINMPKKGKGKGKGKGKVVKPVKAIEYKADGFYIGTVN